MSKLCMFLLMISLAYRSNAQQNKVAAIEKAAEKLAQEQLDAYNKGDIDAFLNVYSEDVAVYNYPDQLLYSGKEAMKKVYSKLFAKSPDLHCHLVNRTVMGNVVIDQEKVKGIAGAGNKTIEALAIYTIKNNVIIEIRFVRK